MAASIIYCPAMTLGIISVTSADTMKRLHFDLRAFTPSLEGKETNSSRWYRSVKLLKSHPTITTSGRGKGKILPGTKLLLNYVIGCNTCRRVLIPFLQVRHLHICADGVVFNADARLPFP